MIRTDGKNGKPAILLDEDKIITEPVIMSDKTDVEFGNIELDVNEQGEIVLSPDKPMHCPTIYMSCQGSEVIVEDIFHGRTAIAKQGHWPVELFRLGHRLDVHGGRRGGPIRGFVYSRLAVRNI
jgi:hypothetical protein